MKQKRYFLEESEIPRQWYNIQADMPVKPAPMLNPETKEPVTVEDLSELFCEECSRQELNTVDRWIDIPEEVLERYGLKSGVEIVALGPGKLMEAGAVEGFVIQYVNDHPVKTPQDVIDVVKKSKRTVFIEGVTPSGRTGYFGFGI